VADLFKLQGIVTVETQRSDRALQQTEALAKKLGYTFDQSANRWRNAAGRIVSSAEIANASLRKTERAAGSLAQRMRGLDGIGQSLTRSLTLPIGLLAGAAVKAATEMDSLKRGLTAVVGSSAEAERQLVRLKEVAKLPGLGFKEVVQGSINLQAAGFSAQLSERSIKAFGNALATVGKGKGELNGVILALGQIESKGKVSAEEINQLAERVPQIRKAIVAAFGTADTEVLQKAKLTSRRFIEGVVTELEKLPQATGGAQNTFENLSDAAQQSMAKIGESVLRIAVPALERLTPKVEAVGQAFSRLSPPVQDAALAIGAIALVAGPVITGLTRIIETVAKLRALVSLPLTIAIGTLTQTGGDQPTLERARANDERNRLRRQRALSTGSQPSRASLLNQPAFVETDAAGRPLNPENPFVKRDALSSLRNPGRRGVGLGTGGGGGKGGSAALTEYQQLQKQLAELNKEIAILGNESSKEYKLKVQIEGLEQKRKDLEELLALRRELGIGGNLDQLRGLSEYNKLSKEGGPRVVVGDLPESLAEILKRESDKIEKQAGIDKLISETTQSLQEQLAALRDPSEEGRTRRALERQGVNPNDDQAQRAVDAARALDAYEAQRKEQDALADAMERSREAAERFREALKDTFENVLDRLLRGDTKGAGNVLKNFGIGLASRGISNAVFGGGGGFGGFGGGGFGQPAYASAGGGGGLLGGLGSVFTGGFAGGPGAGGILGGGSGGGVGGAVNTGLGFLGKLFGGGGGVASGAFAGARAAGSAASAGGFLSKIGGFLGFSNPISAIISGAMIAAPFIAKLFQKDYRKSLRGLIRGEYGLDVKEGKILDGVKQIGESKFGKFFPKRQIETVRLPETRETLYEYAQAKGLRGNGKLFSAAILQDPYSAMNIQKRANGGAYAPGWLLVGERGPELMKTSSSGYVVPNHQLATTERELRRRSEGGGIFASAFRKLADQIAQLMEAQKAMTNEIAAAVRPLRAVRPGDVVAMAGDAVTREVERSFRERTPSSESIRTKLAKR
jgi:tape measure domain-containing protein